MPNGTKSPLGFLLPHPTPWLLTFVACFCIGLPAQAAIKHKHHVHPVRPGHPGHPAHPARPIHPTRAPAEMEKTEEVETVPPAGGGKAPVSGDKNAPPPAGGAPAAPAGGDGVEEIESVDTDSAGGGGASPGEDWYGDAYPQVSRVLDHYTARTARKGNFETLIGHRNWEGILRAPLRDFFGFDGYALKIDLGLRYGIIDQLDIGVLRQNRTFERYTTWEFDIRYQLLTQAAHKLDVALRVGIDWFSHPDKNASGMFVQLLVSRLIANRVFLGGGFMFSGSSSGQNKRPTDPAVSFAMMVQLDVRVLEWLSIAFEITPGLAGYQQPYPNISFGPRIITNRHTFSLVISNTQYVTADGIVANTYRSSYKDWLLGFMITREI